MPLRETVKRRLPIIWRNPAFTAMLPALDVADRVVARTAGRGDLPKFSARIRSSGVGGEFGGKRYVQLSAAMLASLQRIADLGPNDRVLDLGCGSARLGFAMSGWSAPGTYTGFDIDRDAIEACRANKRMRDAGCTFVLAELYNDMYNPEATVDASTFRLPFDDASFDVVFLGSVFTHLLEPEVRNYASEILRILKPGGRCACTAYLIDGPPPAANTAYHFDHEVEGAMVHDVAMPRLAVGYTSKQFDSYFDRSPRSVSYGEWRGGGQGQDMLVYVR